MNKENILKLADIIAAQPYNNNSNDKQGFGMAQVFHTCGTPSCIAGFAVACAMVDHKFVNVRLDLIDHYDTEKAFYKMREDEDIDWDNYAADWLGIPRTNENKTLASELFMPRDVIWSLITPLVAATCLRNLAETGKVEWKVALAAHTPEENDNE